MMTGLVLWMDRTQGMVQLCANLLAVEVTNLVWNFYLLLCYL